MSTTLLVEIPCEISADDRLALKARIGRVVRETLVADVPVSIDHLGVPIKDIDQEA